MLECYQELFLQTDCTVQKNIFASVRLFEQETGFWSERRVFKHKIMYGVAGAWCLSPRWSIVDSCMKMFDSQQLLIFKYFFEPSWEFLMVSLCKSNKLAPLFALAKLASWTRSLEFKAVLIAENQERAPFQTWFSFFVGLFGENCTIICCQKASKVWIPNLSLFSRFWIF